MPPAAEWFANIDNANTRRAYRNDVGEFSSFTGLHNPLELRTVTRAHVISFQSRHGLSADGIVGPVTAHALGS